MVGYQTNFYEKERDKLGSESIHETKELTVNRLRRRVGVDRSPKCKIDKSPWS